MPQLAITVEPRRDGEVAVMRPIGTLCVDNRHLVLSAVVKLLTGGPAAIVVDLSRVTLDDPLAAAVFVAALREASATETKVLLCAPTGALAARLTALVPREPQFPTVTAALAALEPGELLRDRHVRRLPAHPDSDSLAGVLVADACAEWLLPGLIHPARSVMYDLMRSVLACPGSEVTVTVTRRPRWLLLGAQSRLSGPHRPSCVLGRTQMRAVSDHDGIARHRTATRTAHVAWALLTIAS